MIFCLRRNGQKLDDEKDINNFAYGTNLMPLRMYALLGSKF